MLAPNPIISNLGSVKQYDLLCVALFTIVPYSFYLRHKLLMCLQFYFESVSK